MPDLVEEVRARIAEAADPERAPGMQAYMKSAMPFRGVSSVPLRALLGPLLAGHPLPDRAAWEDAVRRLWDGARYREERYAALALARHRLYRAHQDLGTLPMYRHLVVTGAWWDLVDDLASHHVGGIVRSHPDGAVPVLWTWASEDDLWLRRTALLCQLGSKAATDVALLRHALEENLEDSPHGREFFIRKACGWALREHARTDPDWVRAFVAEHEDRLSGLTRHEALKHLA
ncbi:DNA alkylation repair protein [Nocardioides mesophilus]|uniref:DNA alkylation repair protein n=1 Tax=Nocardioides mesophilus TaxID=433659 RepID=A0A7G9RBF8_9ACTN|nr:DNA alkylation repair protein [Nocardioides mesophilus]QNN52933.1 DNA alkylation repair protein [Nocardioides mesophilus]